MTEEKYLKNARDPDQIRRMQILNEKGLCYFCQSENSDGIPFPTIICTGEYWYITPNNYRLEGCVHYYMFVLKRHVEDQSEIRPEEAGELYATMIPWLKKHLGVNSYSTFTRSGNPEITGGSLKHLHMHFLVGGEKPDNFNVTDAIPVVLAFKKK